ncbi:DJ-1/PfpI family protein [Qingshengfaniella alkalisoli]|uniref:DJ-1/PfpI family protein n=1 Tax=Qingshengfaniella alkalisoli TaxID=2599296 RepID=A0A5B8I7S9_9RHOB|nr:DJ-1/PfpI family protein [Qingshengfaniella alkalisoli]QDY69925.1 DJ-1/PfpI family protein [Qingshengfaniella alkalisoli]
MRRVASLVFPGFELLDLFGPLQFLGMLSDMFEVVTVAENRGPVPSNQGVSVNSVRTLAEGDDYDLLLVPGGRGTRSGVGNQALLNWVAQAAGNAEVVMTVCTGSALLAKTGFLDGKRATSNKLAFGWVQQQGPEVEWVKRARWVEDGKAFTSSGVSVGMDMTLAVIARLRGRETAEQVAVWSEYEWHDDPSWDPFAGLYPD